VKIFSGLDAAIIGHASVWHPDGNKVERVIYDGPKLVSIFQQRDGMTDDEAIEYIDFNIEGGYVGEDTPIICWPLDSSNYFWGDNESG